MTDIHSRRVKFDVALTHACGFKVFTAQSRLRTNHYHNLIQTYGTTSLVKLQLKATTNHLNQVYEISQL